jgi:general secretion pathway protein D
MKMEIPGKCIAIFMLLVSAGWAHADQAAAADQSSSVKLEFDNADVRDVIAFYEKLTHQQAVLDNFVQGKITVMTDEPVSREKAVEMIERTLFLNNFAIVQDDPETVEVVGMGKNPRTAGVPTISDPRDLPASERVISYLLTFKYRDAITMQQIVGQYLSPPQTYTSILCPPGTNAIWITERSSVVRQILKAMEKIDIPSAKPNH